MYSKIPPKFIFQAGGSTPQFKQQCVQQCLNLRIITDEVVRSVFTVSTWVYEASLC